MEMRWRYMPSGGSFDEQGAEGAAVEGGVALWWLKRMVLKSWWSGVGGEGGEEVRAGEGAHGGAVGIFAKRREFR